MPSHQHDFMFDVNFAFASESVFTLVDETAGEPLPPIEGFFLTLAGPHFGLLNGQDLTLL
jgi:hypothetical protein